MSEYIPPTAPPFGGGQGYGAKPQGYGSSDPYNAKPQTYSSSDPYSRLQSMSSDPYGRPQAAASDPYSRYQSTTPSDPYSMPSNSDHYGRQQQPQYGRQQSGYGQQYPQQQAGGYGGYPASSYGAPPPTSSSMFPPNTDRAIIQIFQQADSDRSGTIDANELGRLLSEGRVPFSPRTVRLMLHLFADNPADSTRIGPSGFVNLWRELGVWHEKFMEYDRDRSGTIDVRELQQVLLSFHFAIPPAVLDMLVRKYDISGFNRGIGYGQFIECGFIVKGLTEKFRDQDRHRQGSATFDYASFMLMVIPFIAA